MPSYSFIPKKKYIYIYIYIYTGKESSGLESMREREVWPTKRNKSISEDRIDGPPDRTFGKRAGKQIKDQGGQVSGYMERRAAR